MTDPAQAQPVPSARPVLAPWTSEYPELGQQVTCRAEDDGVAIDGLVVLGAGTAGTAWAVALLRECASWGLPVRWRGTAGPDTDTAALHHPPPPEVLDGPAERLLGGTLVTGTARSTTGPGRPGFIRVKDARDLVRAMRYLIAEAGTLAVFTRCLRPAPLAGLSAAERERVAALRADGLLLEAGGMVVTLPARMRRWPVPVDAV
jgi:uncharacterized protein DUF5825